MLKSTQNVKAISHLNDHSTYNNIFRMQVNNVYHNKILIMQL